MPDSDEPLQPLVMLMGSPRSGTTWLAKIIDSHPSVLYRHEPDSTNVRVDIPFVPESEELEAAIAPSREYLDILMNERCSKSSGSQPMFSKDYRGPLGEYLRRLLIYSIKGLERFSSPGSGLASLQIPDLLRSTDNQDPIVFIKSVSSLCRTNLFSLARPETRFVHILRHPCAYVASTVRGKKLGLLSDDAYIETLANMPEASDCDLSLERLKSMSREEQLAVRWMLQNGKVMREMEGEANYMPVVYEELCARPQEIAAEIFSFMGLSTCEQSRDFIDQSSGTQAEAVRYFDVKRDSAKAATGWMKELSEAQIASIRSVVAQSRVGKLYFPE